MIRKKVKTQVKFIKIFNLKKKCAHDTGQVAIILGFLIVTIIGMLAYVIDEGSIYEARSYHQTVADAAALAGVQELPENPSAAIQTAIDYASMHGINLSPDYIEISSTFVENDTISVTSYNLNKQLFFAGIFGRNSISVGAKATAVIGSPSQVTGIVPWGFCSNEYTPGVEYILKYGSPPEPGPGNFGALAIDGSGASVYKDTIIYGSRTPLSIGMWVDPETGNMTGPTKQGTLDRIYNQENYVLDPFSTLTKSSGNVYELINPDSQYIIVPWVSDFGNGNQPVQILGFLQFVITSTQGSVVKATFINKAILQTNEDINAIDSSGLRVIRLLN